MSPGASLRTTLVTGGAGFIGSHLCARLLAAGGRVVCADNFDPFYDPRVKRRSVAALAASDRFVLVEVDVCDPGTVERALADRGFRAGSIDAVVHLAARAGVRPSIDDPVLYTRVNLGGTTAMLEVARRLAIPAFVLGSSSSVYGNSARVPFREDDAVAAPISPYAATKRGAELLCHAHSHLHGIAVACLRFFTVYGPRQRPDLAIHKFARLMAADEPVPVFGDGSTARDYTYVEDICQGVEGAIEFALGKPASFEIFNLGESDTVTLARLMDLLARELGVEPRIRRLPPQPGDVERTFADIGKARLLLGYRPSTRVEEGIPAFVRWFRDEQSRR